MKECTCDQCWQTYRWDLNVPDHIYEKAVKQLPMILSGKLRLEETRHEGKFTIKLCGNCIIKYLESTGEYGYLNVTDAPPPPSKP